MPTSTILDAGFGPNISGLQMPIRWNNPYNLALQPFRLLRKLYAQLSRGSGQSNTHFFLRNLVWLQLAGASAAIYDRLSKHRTTLKPPLSGTSNSLAAPRGEYATLSLRCCLVVNLYQASILL